MQGLFKALFSWNEVLYIATKAYITKIKPIIEKYSQLNDDFVMRLWIVLRGHSILTS